MDIKTLIQKALLEGYSISEITMPTVFACVLISAMIGIYIYIVYKCVNRNSFYNRNFNLSLIALAIITAAIILTIQSNIVVSLGMVGALSIVRFRTAIKDPMDLIFLFWSISAGIICGAGLAMIAVVSSIVLTIIIVLFSIIKKKKGSLVLIVNSEDYRNEERIISIVKHHCSYQKVRARNITSTNLNLAIEVKTRRQTRLIEELMESEVITNISLVEHDGEITA